MLVLRHRLSTPRTHWPKFPTPPGWSSGAGHTRSTMTKSTNSGWTSRCVSVKWSPTALRMRASRSRFDLAFSSLARGAKRVASRQNLSAKSRYSQLRNRGRNAMANWSLCGRHAGPDKPPTPIFINLDNVLTVERQGDLTTVIMVSNEKVYIDTMPETFIGATPPAGPV